MFSGSLKWLQGEPGSGCTSHMGQSGAWLDFLTHRDLPIPPSGCLPRSEVSGRLSGPERPRCQAQACGLGPAVGSLSGYTGQDHQLVCADRWRAVGSSAEKCMKVLLRTHCVHMTLHTSWSWCMSYGLGNYDLSWCQLCIAIPCEH